MATAARCQGTRLLLLLLLLLRAAHPAPLSLRTPGPARCRPGRQPPGLGAAGEAGQTDTPKAMETAPSPTQPSRTITAAAAPPPRLRADPEVLQPRPAPPEERGGDAHAGPAPPAGSPPRAAAALPRARPPAPRPPELAGPSAGGSGPPERVTPATLRSWGRGRALLYFPLT
ncbi:PREDICTED: basic proline-rich protein-like isoform X2 [Chinchilla lanigera]|uniref:basic proline-rich protein-like isoform X2 n=1 Tax=Chinchilla lanigera TaxID=34839 RepID=UPI00038E9A1E|nr:PREDICTED: basic proline-rich protein-like isoform X2 [Chinchilla lanigera]